ncbi:MAG: thioredoxin family protein [Verrucomicrobiales bacterium]|nr:thioredoxin family protein [Verrucomicrobiales bacterium]
MVLFAVLFGVAVVKFELIDVKQLAVDTLGLKIVDKGGEGTDVAESLHFSDSDRSVPESEKVGDLKKEYPVPVMFPIQRTLVDVNGRSLEATILGKREDSIAIRRSSDGKEFVISLENLGVNDRVYFSKIRNQESPVFSTIRKNPLPKKRIARWHYNLVGAQTEAKKYDLPIMLVFTGSSWCKPCQVLEKEVLDTRIFRDYANRNLVLVRITVPVNLKLTGSDAMLREKYNVARYPTMLLLTSSGEKFYSQTGSSTNPQAYVEDLVHYLQLPR